MLAYALSDRVGLLEPMVELFAWSLCLYFFTRQLNHVTDGKFSMLHTPIGVLMLRSSSLLLALF
jgi:hypothetical protein